MAQRRAFGTVRKLPSGRFQARYTHPETGVLEQNAGYVRIDAITVGVDLLGLVRRAARLVQWRSSRSRRRQDQRARNLLNRPAATSMVATE